MNFLNDLRFGNKYEKEFCNIMKLDKYMISEGNFKYFDVLDEKNNITYEIKADRQTFKTKNIAIEIECNKKPSGLMTTDADNWVYFVVKDNDEYDMYIIPTDKLRELIKDNKKVIYGGDNRKSKIHLLKLELIKEYFIKN